MDELRTVFEALGFLQVKTFIQSGNVVFKTQKTLTDETSKNIEAKILAQFGFAVSVISRSLEEIEEAKEKNPFLREPDIDVTKLHVAFLSGVPKSDGLKRLAELPIAPDRFHCVGRQLYLFLPNGVAGSLLMKKPLDRILSVVTTMRNWKTVNSLLQMCRDCG